MDRKTDSNHSFGYTRQRVLYTPALATGQAEWASIPTRGEGNGCQILSRLPDIALLLQKH